MSPHRRPPRPLPHRVQSVCKVCGAETWAGVPTVRCDDCAPSGATPRLYGWMEENLPPVYETTLAALTEAARELAETLEVEGVEVADPLDEKPANQVFAWQNPQRYL